MISHDSAISDPCFSLKGFFSTPSSLNHSTLDLAASEVPEIDEDLAALEIARRKRQDKARAYFNELAGKFGRHYCPGRSWKGLAETLLKLLPPLVIADLGAGEGTFSQLLAQKAEKVIAIDNSEKMVEYGAGLAKDHGFLNLEYRLGDIMEPPIDDGSVDLAFFSQALHHYDLAIDSNPGESMYYTNKAAALMLLKRYSEALTACSAAINLN